MVPEWLDADRLQWAILAAIAGVLYSMYLVARFVRRALTKFLLFVLLGGLGLSLWLQRADLEQCVQTCSCSLYGEHVDIPPDRVGDRCALP